MSGIKFLSSCKEQVFTYETVIRNNKKTAIKILVIYQFPLSTNNEITIEIMQLNLAKLNSETEMVDWNLKLAP